MIKTVIVYVHTHAYIIANKSLTLAHVIVFFSNPILTSVVAISARAATATARGKAISIRCTIKCNQR